MDVIRSALNVSPADIFENFVTGLDYCFENKILNHDEDETTGVTDTVRYDISEDTYLEFKFNTTTANKYNSTFMLYYNGGSKTLLSISNSSNKYYNFSIYKYESCVGISLKNGTSSITAYSMDALLYIDSIKDSTKKALFISSSATYVDIVFTNELNVSNVMTNYSPYSSNSSATTNTIQIIPFICSRSGYQLEHIYGVCISPVMNQFVSFNGEKWLFSRYLAIPCGDNINYIYI